jgi:hypothetical protein
MTTYILIIFMSLGYGQSDIKFQEFNSQQTCNSVLEIIKKANEKAISVCMIK